MPQLPVIIPLIIIGISFGSLLKSEKPKISLRRVMIWALVAGLLNAVNAYAVYLLTPQPTFGGATFARTTTTTLIPFTAASFLAGFIIVAAVSPLHVWLVEGIKAMLNLVKSQNPS